MSLECQIPQGAKRVEFGRWALMTVNVLCFSPSSLFSRTDFIQNRGPPGDQLYLLGCSFLLYLEDKLNDKMKGLLETEGWR